MAKTTMKMDDKWRVVEAQTGTVAIDKDGKPIDEGGHDSIEAAQAQCRGLNRDAMQASEPKK